MRSEAAVRWPAVLFPAAVAGLLSLPCLAFTFLWDDYLFLANALNANLRDWLPRADDPFYRPISRALYFAIVAPFGARGALLAHLLNFAYLLAVVVCLTALAARLRGRTYALAVGVLFAGMAAAPALVGWASCSQDLLAILFVVLAFLALSRGRDGLALIAFGAALLSKETALSMAPALAAWDWLLWGSRRRLGRRTAMFAAVVVGWSAIHPAIHVLLARRLAPGATGYVGLTNPMTWLWHAGQYLSVLANLRLARFDPTWPPMTTVYLLLVALAAAYGFGAMSQQSAPEPRLQNRPPARRLAAFGFCLMVLPLVMTSTMILSWAPYYAAFPMVGLALLGGLLLERLRVRDRAVVVGAYLLLGIWARGSDLDKVHVTERQLRPSSDAMKKIESEFMTLAPKMPPETDIVLSIQAGGLSRIYPQMYGYQPVRLWYRDPTLRVMKPLDYRPSDRTLLVSTITPDLDLVFIDPNTFATRSASGRPPDYIACEKTLRTLAVGLGGAGFVGQGAALLLGIPNVDLGSRSIHMRTAAMLLLGAGRRALADSLIAAAPAIPRQIVLADLHAILAEQPSGMVYDDEAFRAFGIRPDDIDALRDIAAWLARLGYGPPARRLASRLLELQPNDPVGLRSLALADSAIAEVAKQARHGF